MMLIAIDHGNKQMKTAHQTFSSGLCEKRHQTALWRKCAALQGEVLHAF